MAKKILPRINGALKTINETIERLNNITINNILIAHVIIKIHNKELYICLNSGEMAHKQPRI